MTFAAIHPGVNNQYVEYGATAEEAESKLRATLEQNHGGLASGMLANSRVEELSDTLPGGEDLGRCWNNTPASLNDQGATWVWAEGASTEDYKSAEGYYTDEAGEPVLLVLAWDEDEDAD